MVSTASMQYGDKKNGNRLGKGGSFVWATPIIRQGPPSCWRREALER
jgi:hypothetical protein